VSTLAVGPTQIPIEWVLDALSPGVYWPGQEANYSPPSSAEVKNGGAIPPLSSHVHLHGLVLNSLSTGTALALYVYCYEFCFLWM
jgi:hypothetical protein